jgi:phosphatidate cytidylyltransferase
VALKREIAAAVAIPVVLGILFLLPSIAFDLLVAAIGLAALWEFYRLAEKTGHPVAKSVGIAAGAVMLFAAAFRFAGSAEMPSSTLSPGVMQRVSSIASDLRWMQIGGAGFVWFLLVLVFLSTLASLFALPPSVALAGSASTVFGVLSVALPTAAMDYLRLISPRAVLFLFLIVWGCDSFAYYTGRALGKHKLAPRISPNKTWEGTIGGFVGATLIGAAGGTWWLAPQLGPGMGAVAGALASSAGQIGDLVESMWKRGAGVKDSGTFLPGHGGFYDRVDSLLFAGPVLAVILALTSLPS